MQNPAIAFKLSEQEVFASKSKALASRQDLAGHIVSLNQAELRTVACCSGMKKDHNNFDAIKNIFKNT